MEDPVRKAFQETVVQKLRRWDTAIMTLENEFCAGPGPRVADLTSRIEKLAAKRRAAVAMLLELGALPPAQAIPLQIPQ